MVSNMGLLNAFKQYVRDAMPGGALNPEVTYQGLLDTAALGTAPVPIVGDVLGLLGGGSALLGGLLYNQSGQSQDKTESRP